MGLESIDFQSLVHQQVTLLIDQWSAMEIPVEDVQEAASQFFNMGLIAAQQIQQEGGITPQGANQTIPYTNEMAERIVVMFLQGLGAAIVKAHEQRIPSEEKWKLMQNVAYHVFEQSKQAIVATLGQESTPGVQITDEQIENWLGQTAVEALLYYITEHEKQYGPISRVGEEEMPDLLNQGLEQYDETPQDMPTDEWDDTEATPETVPQSPQQQPVSHGAIPAIYHKYAAVGLFVSSLPVSKQQKILVAFKPEEQQIINQYRNPEVIASQLDLGLVARYLKEFKERMGQGKGVSKSQYASTISQVVSSLPVHRLERLFQHERPLVRGYVGQFVHASDRDFDPYTLPPGVEESLILYLHRNFPEVASL
jgi:hypothetical protein